MMGHREPLKGGGEWDAFTGWRKFVAKRAGKFAWIKRKFNKRIRKDAKQEIRTPESEGRDG